MLIEEFFDGEIYAMAEGSEDHSALALKVLTALLGAIGDRPCRVHTSDLRIYVEAVGFATFPDVSVICGPLQQHAPSPDATALNPLVLLEVTSDSSEECCGGISARPRGRARPAYEGGLDAAMTRSTSSSRNREQIEIACLSEMRMKAGERGTPVRSMAARCRRAAAGRAPGATRAYRSAWEGADHRSSSHRRPVEAMRTLREPQAGHVVLPGVAAERARIKWLFTVERARQKLGRAYPVPADLTSPAAAAA